MNTYQSPYIDGQVVDTENAEPLRRGPETAPLPAAPADAKISGCTKSASDCLHKTTKLAREFNHGTVSAAHLILAMTLIPNASRQFELRKMDIDRAFRAAMHALMDIERGTPSNGALPGLSEEFNVIVTLAQELARNRDNQEVSVDDLLTALDRLPEDSSAAQLVRGERKNGGGTGDMNAAFAQLSFAMDQQFQGIRQAIEMLRIDMQRDDIERMKRYLEQRDGVIERLIREGFAQAEKKPAAPAPESLNDGPQNPSSPSGGAAEDSLWERIFGRKSADVSPPLAEPSPVQTRWGL
ncbi:MAG: Clp protease N-terminal domain-containing protein [Pseudomonadota bacterium]